MKRIYLHTSDKEKRSVIGRICKEQDIVIKDITGSDCNRIVADICGMDIRSKGAHKKAPVIYVLPELMLFYGIDDEGLDLFLDAYNATGTEKIRRKAVITPVNLGWSIYELAEQLEEHEKGMS